MPELPDIAVYVRALEARVLGRKLLKVRLGNVFLLRTADPPISTVEERIVLAVRRMGKRIVFSLEGDLHLVLHLMIAGRLQWKTREVRLGGRYTLAAFDFEDGCLVLTEAGTKRRASLHLVQGAAALREMDPGGLEVLEADLEQFAGALRRENHTLKRSLTDPRVLSGIGNSYSDEILHRARLSPFKLTSRITDEELESLFAATRSVLTEWTERLAAEAGEAFPTDVTAFHAEMAVHGKYARPCPVCGSPVQRIVYAENEANYCATCQTGGKVLADRGLSRLLREDWPRTLAELEERKILPQRRPES